jgi:hypothetical protein
MLILGFDPEVVRNINLLNSDSFRERERATDYLDEKSEDYLFVLRMVSYLHNDLEVRRRLRNVRERESEMPH